MNYQLGARLGPHVDISFEPPAWRNASLLLRSATAIDKRTRAALRVQKAYRKYRARKRMQLVRKQSCLKPVTQCVAVPLSKVRPSPLACTDSLFRTLY